METGVATQFIKSRPTAYIRTKVASMRNLNWLAATALAIAFVCPAYAETPFSDEDFAAFRGDGQATLEGEAFVKTENGEVRNCSGETVFLAPDTPFDFEVITAFLFHLDLALKRAGPAAQYWRESSCDSQGKFNFDDVPVGNWIVITAVRWGNSGRVIGGTRQGGQLAKKISLRSGKNRIVMNMKNFRDPIFGFDLKK